MPRAELVFANALDGRIYEAEGEGGQPLLYTLSLPGRVLPFVVVRDWKAPQGVVLERFELIGPSGRVAYASEPRVRRMPGQMDLTRIIDVVENALVEELGIFLVSFIVDDEVQGQIACQVVFQQAPQQLPKEVEDALRKTDVIWVGVEQNGRDRAVPVWFVYRQGRIYVLHAEKADTGEQVIPGLPDAPELVVVTRHKYRETRSDRFPAAVRLISPQDAEFDSIAALLADRRRDRHGPPGDAVKRWRSGCLIAELTPALPV